MESPEYLQSELPAINLFKKLGYDYFNGKDSDNRESINEVVLKDRLEAALRKLNPWINENNLKNAIKHITSIQGSSLMEINENIHEYLSSRKFTVKQVVEGREQHKGVSFIDFENIQLNDFLIVNQLKFKGKERNSIPDIIVYLNGLPVAVIECKSAKAQQAEHESIRDLLYYQENSEKLLIAKLFGLNPQIIWRLDRQII
jgi:type I restriction enzyme, R subunit